MDSFRDAAERSTSAARSSRRRRVAVVILLAALFAPGLHLSASPASAAVSVEFSDGCTYDVTDFDGTTITLFGFQVTVSGLEPSTVYLGQMTFQELEGTSTSSGTSDESGNFTVGLQVFTFQATGRESFTLESFTVLELDGTVVAEAGPFTVTCPRSLEDRLALAVSDGLLSDGQASSLLAKFEAARVSVENDNAAIAIKQLRAFIAQVRALLSAGRLTTGIGLIQAAEKWIADLETLL
jgi:hypothetical protein